MSGSGASAQQRVAALDGLRGVAILWVLLHQLVVVAPATTLEQLLLWPACFGWVGVTLFFVLSGYLITGVLLRTRDAPQRAGSFYARRALRILPLYYVLLLAVYAASIVGLESFDTHHLTPWQFGSFWALLGNWAMAQSGDYLVGPLAVTWSVAIEEQFYLVWPWVVWRFSPAKLQGLCLALVGVSLAARLYGLWAEWDGLSIYVGTPTRFDALAVGSAAAVLVHRGYQPMRHAGRLLATALVCGVAAAAGDLVATIASGPVAYDVSAWSLGPGITLGALAAGAVLLLVSDPKRAPSWARALEAPWLRSLGLYSYGIYLTHSPVRAVVRDYLFGPGYDGATPLFEFPTVGGSHLPALAAYTAICVPLCWVVGMLSYRLIEWPLLRLKSNFSAGNLQR